MTVPSTSQEPTNNVPPEQRSDAIPLERAAPLYLLSNTPKGRGVFAARPIPSGTVIDTCPVLVLSPEENAMHIEKTLLYHYTYNWPLPPTKASSPSSASSSRRKTQALVLGLGSMFNHSSLHQNVGWTRNLEREVVVYRTLRDVGVGEELCISYGGAGQLTFVDAEAEGVRAEVEADLRLESEGEVLARIEVDL